MGGGLAGPGDARGRTTAASSSSTTTAAAAHAVGVAPLAAAQQPQPSGSRGLTQAEVAALARQALHDPAALAQLRQVRRVDGRPVDLAAALPADDPAGLTARLEVLARGAPASEGSPSDRARSDARAVLAQPRFHAHEPPRPLRGPLRWIGRQIEPVLAPIGRFFEHLVPHRWRFPLLGLALAVLTALLATYFTRRRSRAAVDRHRRLAGLVGDAEDPRRLERRADAAEAVGDYGEAVRLRFLAGLVRLDRAGVVEVRTSETTGQLRAALGDGSFDVLAGGFDEIVYGRRVATAADAAAARAGWSRLLAPRRTEAAVPT